MWEDFQKVLEKRVNNKKVVKNDKYLVITTTKKTLKRIFGEVSEKFIEVKDFKKDRIWIEIKNSTWRSEVKLHEKRIIKELNKDLNSNLIKNISTN